MWDLINPDLGLSQLEKDVLGEWAVDEYFINDIAAYDTIEKYQLDYPFWFDVYEEDSDYPRFFHIDYPYDTTKTRERYFFGERWGADDDQKTLYIGASINYFRRDSTLLPIYKKAFPFNQSLECTSVSRTSLYLNIKNEDLAYRIILKRISYKKN